MTPKGKEFVERFEKAQSFIKGGMPIFAALAASFEDDDWDVAFAAIAAIVEDIKAT